MHIYIKDEKIDVSIKGSQEIEKAITMLELTKKKLLDALMEHNTETIVEIRDEGGN